jgi:hypothetical protein
LQVQKLKRKMSWYIGNWNQRNPESLIRNV